MVTRRQIGSVIFLVISLVVYTTYSITNYGHVQAQSTIDNFNRTVTSGFGNGWNTVFTSGARADSNTSVDGSQAVFTLTDATVSTLALQRAVLTDSNVTTIFAGDNSTSFGLLAKVSATGYYRCYVPVNGNFMLITESLQSPEYIIGYVKLPFTIQPSTQYKMRYTILKDKMSAKLWAVSDVEPLDYNIVITNSDILSGEVGIAAQVEAGVQTAYVHADDFAIWP